MKGDITINLYYRGENGSAKEFVKEMEESGIAGKIRNEKGNKKYDYFFSAKDSETVLLIDSWENQEALDAHHASPMMEQIALLREKYNLHMTVERYISADTPSVDEKFIRR